MSYSSLSFFIFLAVLTLVYYIAPKRYQWCVLLAASYGFYLTGGVPQLIFIICSTLIAYFAGLKMQSIRDQAKAEMEKAGELTKEEKREWKKRTKDKVHRVQILSVGLTLGILIVVKYTIVLLSGESVCFALCG